MQEDLQGKQPEKQHNGSEMLSGLLAAPEQFVRGVRAPGAKSALVGAIKEFLEEPPDIERTKSLVIALKNNPEIAGELKSEIGKLFVRTVFLQTDIDSESRNAVGETLAEIMQSFPDGEQVMINGFRASMEPEELSTREIVRLTTELRNEGNKILAAHLVPEQVKLFIDLQSRDGSPSQVDLASLNVSKLLEKTLAPEIQIDQEHASELFKILRGPDTFVLDRLLAGKLYIQADRTVGGLDDLEPAIDAIFEAGEAAGALFPEFSAGSDLAREIMDYASEVLNVNCKPILLADALQDAEGFKLQILTEALGENITFTYGYFCSKLESGSLEEKLASTHVFSQHADKLGDPQRELARGLVRKMLDVKAGDEQLRESEAHMVIDCYVALGGSERELRQ